MKKPILCLDFDGVIHSYTSGWKGADVIPDEPVPGAMDFIIHAKKDFQIHIFSSRSNQPGGVAAMDAWLRAHLMKAFDDLYENKQLALARFQMAMEKIHWPTEKPPAMVTIDDRAITFTGEWPDMGTLKTFKPWNKKEATPMSKTPKKWTKWIPHTGDECPVDGEEVVRVKFADGLVCKYQIANTWEWEAFNDDGRITHYKRLRAKSLKDRPPNRRGPFVITDADLGVDKASEFEDVCAQGREAEEFRDNATHGARLMRSAIQARELCKSGAAAKQAYEHYTREGLLNKIDGLESDLEAAVETAWKRGAERWTALNYPELSEKFSSRADQETCAEYDPHESARHDPEQSEPAPIITGPGLYKTSGLYQAEIFHLLPNGTWSGIFGATPDQDTVWNSDGTTGHPDALIIGPWEEPEGEPEPEMWVNVYEPSAPTPPYAGPIHESKRQAEDSYKPCGHIGTFKLTKGEG